MKVAKEFSRFAKSYNHHNIIQIQVAQSLVSMLNKEEYSTILDIGCGRGEIYQNLAKKNIKYSHLSALDIASGMLKLHPTDKKTILVDGDFSIDSTFEQLPKSRYDLMISSSALQWSRDLDITLSNLSMISDSGYFAIFTSATFSSLHNCAGVTSPIYSENHLREKIDLYFNASYNIEKYKLHFNSVYEMLRYIKESGTSGGEKQLTYRQTKKLLDNYALDYLEFEVLFVRTKVKS